MLEAPYERADGEVRWFKVAGAVARGIPDICWGVIQDITKFENRRRNNRSVRHHQTLGQCYLKNLAENSNI